jgi:hypothetical protein
MAIVALRVFWDFLKTRSRPSVGASSEAMYSSQVTFLHAGGFSDARRGIWKWELKVLLLGKFNGLLDVKTEKVLRKVL